MFHSRGTVQSKTSVPVGTSSTWSGISAPIRSRVASHPVAGDAAADRVELLDQPVHPPPRLGGIGGDSRVAGCPVIVAHGSPSRRQDVARQLVVRRCPFCSAPQVSGTPSSMKPRAAREQVVVVQVDHLVVGRAGQHGPSAPLEPVPEAAGRRQQDQRPAVAAVGRGFGEPSMVRVEGLGPRAADGEPRQSYSNPRPSRVSKRGIRQLPGAGGEPARLDAHSPAGARRRAASRRRRWRRSGRRPSAR